MMGIGWAATLALAAVVSFGLATLLEFWRGDVQKAAVLETEQERYERLEQLEEGMAKESSSYRWINKAEGKVQLPIEQAMHVTLADLQVRPPQPSGVPVAPGTMGVDLEALGIAPPPATKPPEDSGAGLESATDSLPDEKETEAPEGSPSETEATGPGDGEADGATPTAEQGETVEA